MSSLRLSAAPKMPTLAAHDLLRRALREIPLIAVLYFAYAGGRIIASHHTGAAFDHAESVWSFERLVGLPSEYGIQQLALHQHWLIEAMGFYYARVHFPAMILMLVWLFLRRPSAYPWFRWTLALLTGLALIGHMLYPLAPPRMLTDHGMVDTAHVYGQSVYGPVGTGLANQFAAMPSLHVAWAVLIAIAIVRTVRSPWRWLAVLHPVATLAVVIVTGNHYWLDGIVGCALLLVALAVTSTLRPIAAADPTQSAGLAGSAGSAGSARSAGTARSAGSAGSAGFGGSGRQVWPAASTWVRRVGRQHAWPFVRFVVVGSGSTLLSAVIFLPLLPFMPSIVANTVAAVISTLLSNEAHRSWTFRSDRNGLGARVAAAVTVLLSYVVTTVALLVFDSMVPDASAGLELTVMLIASAVAGLARYLLLGLHIFPAAVDAPQTESPQSESSRTEPSRTEPSQAGEPSPAGVGSPASTQLSALSMACSSAR